MPIVVERAFAEGVADLLAAPRNTGGTTAARPPRTASPDWLEAALAERRAVRSFSDEPVEAARIRDALTEARALHADLFPGAQDLTVLLAASRVSGLAPGLYREDEHTWSPAPGDVDAMRPWYDGAPAVLLIGADTAAACARAGAAGYAELLVSGAGLAYTTWLAALARGLSGCPYGRSYDAPTAAFRSQEPGLRHVMALSLGHGDEPQ
ncbi:hypothetical protein [Streptomyces tubercidicus]|uniref:nitroreductase family protein n=1 Tax=Streptomyces tubercidicus TaxID=47759 RepID=UPI002E196CEB|nr:nitroreductase family protein [Streptomyces tubercidicus]